MVYEAEKGNLTIALAGDTMLTRKLIPFKEEKFLQLREILCAADAAFANLEGTVHAWDEGTPGITQGTFMTTDPKLLDDLKWLGVNLVSCANNHAFDYGEDCVLANLRHLDAAGLTHAGTGKNLAQARAPSYLDTPNGRVGAAKNLPELQKLFFLERNQFTRQHGIARQSDREISSFSIVRHVSSPSAI